MGNYSVWPPRLGEGLVTHKNESLGPWYVLFSHIRQSLLVCKTSAKHRADLAPLTDNYVETSLRNLAWPDTRDYSLCYKLHAFWLRQTLAGVCEGLD